ncbi:hypothetical protein, partial [Epibacterium ulvae]|uniref:hypothetical protein n=1 Tax=Epibacterium ulvae TaxID=1156985 RepID=UPI002491E598
GKARSHSNGKWPKRALGAAQKRDRSRSILGENTGAVLSDNQQCFASRTNSGKIERWKQAMKNCNVL